MFGDHRFFYINISYKMFSSLIFNCCFLTEKSCEVLLCYVFLFWFCYFSVDIFGFLFLHVFGTLSSAFPFCYFQIPSKNPFTFLPQGGSSSCPFFLLHKFSLPCSNIASSVVLSTQIGVVLLLYIGISNMKAFHLELYLGLG